MITAVTVPLHCLSKDEYKGAVDDLPHRWEKCVGNAGDLHWLEDLMCEQSGTSVVLLSSILLLQ
jgi:hypothetical protein